MIIYNNIFTKDKPNMTIPKFGIYALDSTLIQHELNEDNYTPCLRVNESYNLVDVDNTIHHVIEAENITTALLSLAPPKKGLYENIFYNTEDLFEPGSIQSNSNVHNKIINISTITKELLSKSGTLFVQVPEDYVSIVKLTLQEVFGKNNYISTFIVNGNKAGVTKRGIANQHYYILTVANNFEECSNTHAYLLNNSRTFCNESEEGDIDSGQDYIKTDYEYEDDISPYRLNSYMRSESKSKGKDGSYFPIYYFPVNNSKIDLEPRLFVDNPNLPGIVEIYPTGDNGIKYKWNGNKDKVVTMINNNNLVVKNLGGSYRIEYKSRPNLSSNGNKLIPLRNIVEDNVSNMTLTLDMQKLTGYKNNYYGFNSNLIKILVGAFNSIDGEILFLGDDFMTGLSGLNKENLNISTTTISTDNDKSERSILSLVNSYNSQIIKYNINFLKGEDDLSFVEKFNNIDSYCTIKYESILLHEDNDHYTIKETPDGTLLIILKVYYDFDVYEEISNRIRDILGNSINDTLVIISYQNDTNTFLGDIHFKGIRYEAENISLDILSVQHRLYRKMFTGIK